MDRMREIERVLRQVQRVQRVCREVDQVARRLRDMDPALMQELVQQARDAAPHGQD